VLAASVTFTAGQRWLAGESAADRSRSRVPGLGQPDTLQAQVFQNAICNWRCWYCYVPFNMLSGNESRVPGLRRTILWISTWHSRPPAMIDLTGGQPDLVPEWVPWTMAALQDAASPTRSTYGRRQLSNDYFFRHLSDNTRQMVADYPGYGRVCCFKDSTHSRSLQHEGSPDLFDRQFDVFSQLLETGMDIYAYATLLRLGRRNPGVDGYVRGSAPADLGGTAAPAHPAGDRGVRTGHQENQGWHRTSMDVQQLQSSAGPPSSTPLLRCRSGAPINEVPVGRVDEYPGEVDVVRATGR